jgi:hypothetical protein
VRGKEGKKNTERTSGSLNLKLSGWDSVCISPTDMAEAWDHHTQNLAQLTHGEFIRLYQNIRKYQNIRIYQKIK